MTAAFYHIQVFLPVELHHDVIVVVNECDLVCHDGNHEIDERHRCQENEDKVQNPDAVHVFGGIIDDVQGQVERFIEALQNSHRRGSLRARRGVVKQGSKHEQPKAIHQRKSQRHSYSTPQLKG